MRYKGLVNGVPATLDASSDAESWSATIDVGGYGYRIVGHLTGTHLVGSLTDTVTAAVLPATGTVSADEVLIHSPVQLRFTRTGHSGGTGHFGGPGHSGGTGRSARTGHSGGVEPTTTQADRSGGSNIDGRIAGVWLWTDALSSDGLAVVSQQRTVLDSDGTFVQYDARSAGAGLDGAHGSGGSVIASGYWRADGSTLFLSAGGTFIPTASYQTDGASLLLSFADGSRQLWSRLSA